MPAYRPRPELQKVAPRNFAAFFVEDAKKTTKFLRCRVAKMRRALCNSRLQHDDSSFACRNQAAENKEGNAMSKTYINPHSDEFWQNEKAKVVANRELQPRNTEYQRGLEDAAALLELKFGDQAKDMALEIRYRARIRKRSTLLTAATRQNHVSPGYKERGWRLA
jgi:hypothetical protein